MNTQLVTKSSERVSLVQKFARRFSIEHDKLLIILKATAFKVRDGEVSDEQMAALLVVADQYGLNPFTKEIFAFPDKQNGIVPVVGVDGWSRIINDHPQADGLEFRYAQEILNLPDAQPCPAWCEVVIFRKDRGHPIVVREYLEECYRPAFQRQDGSKVKGPWQTHTRRFLRHKTLIQGARIAFGFGGIYDEDEATRIIEAEAVAAPSEPPVRGTAALAALAALKAAETAPDALGAVPPAVAATLSVPDESSSLAAEAENQAPPEPTPEESRLADAIAFLDTCDTGAEVTAFQKAQTPEIQENANFSMAVLRRFEAIKAKAKK